MGILQTWNYFAARHTDAMAVQTTASRDNTIVLLTVQVIFFFISSYIYFSSRIHRLTEGRSRLSAAAFGIYIIAYLCILPQRVTYLCLSRYELRSFLKLGTTKPITTLQSAASFACDILITTYLCLFLKSQKGDMIKTNLMMDRLIHDAINCGVLTALSSGMNMVLFLAVPDTFWFFLGLAPSSKLYMNSMMATLNGRHQIRKTFNDKEWNSIPIGTLATSPGGDSRSNQDQDSFAAVEFAKTTSLASVASSAV
ncbi:hypothetical protein R3P38DRAFT_2583681 [Favolaschia claudopus]|uniref:DUF6534 domain-containing protein n=1 Tax=Favolaschia claudopus TaxID=2862362 RepID=A0AAV9Z8E1_9AGAR